MLISFHLSFLEGLDLSYILLPLMHPSYLLIFPAIPSQFLKSVLPGIIPSCPVPQGPWVHCSSA